MATRLPTDLAPQTGVVLGFNAGSGAGDRSRRVAALADELGEAGFTVRISTRLPETIDLARQWHAEGRLRACLACGGDGTVRTLAEQLPGGTPIAILPLGTENLLARYLGIDGRNATAIATLAGGREFWMDAGQANGRMFLVMLSAGFDADVVQRVHASRRGNTHRSHYAFHTLRAIWNYRFPSLGITADGQPLQPARWLFAFNVPRYAMNLRIAPDADPADGMLDLCAFPRGGLLTGLRYIAAIRLGRHPAWTGADRLSAREFTIDGPPEVPWQIDGDPGGTLPVQVLTLPRRVRFLLPPVATS